MILTKEQREQLEEAAKPLMKFLSENFHPHVHVTVDSNTAEFVEGVATVRFDGYLLD